MLALVEYGIYFYKAYLATLLRIIATYILLMIQVEYRDRSKEYLKRRCRIVNKKLSEDEIETMLDEGNTQMFNGSILQDTTKAREQLNELKGK